MSLQLASPVATSDDPFTSKKDGKIVETALNGNGSGHAGNPDPQTPLSNKRSSPGLSRSNTLQMSSRTQPSTPPTNTALDPLSNQIFLRTNSGTETSLAQRLRNSARPESPTPEGLARKSIDGVTKFANGFPDLTKDRKKGTSFLSRLAMRSSFRKTDIDLPDSDSDLGDLRTEGSSARAPTSVMSDGGGYIPLYKEPPRYIRVRSHNSRRRDFNRLFLAQELLGTDPDKEEEPSQARAPATAVGTRLLKAGDPIWAAEFSIDGRYLAVAGKDQVVRVFAVISTPEERKAHEEEEQVDKDSSYKGKGERLSAPVFRTKPIREFKAHTGEVLALCWSKNNFLLSTSMDKTVRLWHVSREECLATYKHNDLVTSIAFHPTDDRFFLAGSLDAQLRLWSIPDKTVAFSASTSEFITAVAFSPDGKTAICGLLNGMCLFYETEGLKLKFQIHVRSSRGKNAKGSKITGIKTAALPAGSPHADVKVLISSNDSRIRIYSMKARMLEVKFKGLENQSSQIHARFSDDGNYVISGSEDRKAYIWNMNTSEADFKDRQPFEYFDAHPEVVTTALMAPMRTKQLLSASGDPIFDLCNPPPVLLQSLDEATKSQTEISDTGTEIHHPPPSVKKPEESPAYIERSKHLDGNIIVTTDRTGTIKVFRQDCAYRKRQQNMWEVGSKFSSKVGGLGRSGSIITRTSGSQSRRASLNLNPGQIQHPSDRIMSWRQDVDEEERIGFNATPSRSERSASPRKMPSRTPLSISSSNLSDTRKGPLANASPVRSIRTPVSPGASVRTKPSVGEIRNGPTKPPTPSFNFVSVDENEEQAKGDTGFWNLSRWRGSISGSISGLRYSTSAMSPSETSHEDDGTTVGISRTGSMSLAAPDRSAARKSFGAADLARLKVADDTSNRRRSMGATIRARSVEKSATIETIDEAAGSDPFSIKKRTDSGVGRMSGDTDE